MYSTGQQSGQSFDRLAGHYDRLGQLADSQLDAYLAARLPAQPGGRAVDLGCGTGRHAALLAGWFDEVLAVDLSAPMLAFAQRHRSRPNVRYEQRDLGAVVAERDGRFDFVLSVFTLHHVPDVARVLDQVRGLVAPGGQAILVDLCDQPRPAGWFRRRALRTLATDLLRRRRPVGEAGELYRRATDPAWLAHQTTDRPLPPGQFERTYGSAFPGAAVTPLPRARAVHWHRPQPAS
jgi:SAM-dependent methyltransferase